MEAAVTWERVRRTMKLHVRLGPLPIAPPYFDWEEDDSDLIEENEEEIDLTDLFDPPKPNDVERIH
jgi:hypothetical protein